VTPLSVSGHLVRAFWRLIGRLLTPAVLLLLLWRRHKGKEDAARWRERLGTDDTERPEGILVWIHAVSVGESLSVLPLIAALRQRHPGWHLLLTTGTPASAAAMAAHLPPGVFHRYVPVDIPLAVDRFFSGWRPDLALFVEQELWPGLVLELRSRMIPAVLLNARLSPRSAARWRRLAPLARLLYSAFDPVMAPGQSVAARLESLGLQQVRRCEQLKMAAAPLVADPAALAEARSVCDGRPVLVAASLQPGEAAPLAEIHDRLVEQFPDLLTILVPRHPDRMGEWPEKLQALPRRSAGAALPPGGLHVADTMGELGLWYRLATVAFIGGSLVPYGGHNPSEAPRLGTPALIGPHYFNCRDLAETLCEVGVLEIAETPDDLCRRIAAHLAAPRRVTLPEAGRVLDEVISVIEKALMPG
jgi:3-deoxy-D-manno-octulosonic-acid transferase